jgi:zinc D-Ala-D-Ala carboxypeptidase
MDEVVLNDLEHPDNEVFYGAEVGDDQLPPLEGFDDEPVSRRDRGPRSLSLTRAQQVTILTNLGFRVDTAARFTQAVRDFQRGWNLGTALRIDGDPGTHTQDALTLSEARRRAGVPTMSAHFSFKEFQCKCGGKYAACRRIWTLRPHVQRLEQYRTKINRPVTVVSGCRCPDHNEAVGGARSSQHMFGSASDLTGPDRGTVRSFRIFAGIGFAASDDGVRHLDSRDLSGHNSTSGTPAAPTVWKYSQF